ncbi:MAG: glycosyltransferase family 4 protein [Deltaproteobacteria bacterium]|nr:glycosyltransferase family 4 protein [Deltaproteobacteria bacterium]
MRLGLVIYGSLDIISGGFLYDRILVDYLRHQGEQVEIIALPWRTYPRNLADNFSAAVFRRLAEIKVDVLIQDELCHPSLFRQNRLYRRRFQEVPVISLVHHLRCSEARPAWQNRLYRLVERLYLNSTDGFIFNSRATKREVEAVVGRMKPSVMAVPGGDRFAATLSDAALMARAKSPGPLQILFLGNLIPRKGLHTLLEALASLPRLWRLVAAGSLDMDTAYVRAVRRQVARLGLAEEVAFTGPLAEDEVAAFLAQSHVLAVPSTYEGYGIVYVEGMSFGLPAIATTAGGAREIITHGHDGFLVPPEDPAGLAECLEILLQDREKLLAMSLAARKTFLAHPTWQETCRSIHQFLQDIAGK